MSYNIENIDIIVIRATMEVADIIDLADKYENDLPSDCFLIDIYRDSLSLMKEHFKKKLSTDKLPIISLHQINWCGEGSGSSWRKIFLQEICPKIKGEVEAIVSWEEPGVYGGLAIKNGKVIEPDVVRRLILPKDW